MFTWPEVAQTESTTLPELRFLLKSVARFALCRFCNCEAKLLRDGSHGTSFIELRIVGGGQLLIVS